MSFACTFCGRPHAQCGKLVSGFDGLICDACVALCIEAAPAADSPGTPPISVQPSQLDLAPVLQQYLDGRPVQFGHDRTRCSFCGKDPHGVRLFYRGQVSCICAECIGVCIDVMVAELGGEWTVRQRAWPEAGSNVG
jgi:ATP-dependent protease Clp ATPase subunit